MSSNAKCPRYAGPLPMYSEGRCACCNITLRKGCLIIASLGIILGALFAFVGYCYMTGANQFAKEDKPGNVSKADVHKLAKAYRTEGTILLASGSVQLLASIVLIVGVLKEIPAVCLVWVFSKVLEILLDLAVVVIPGIIYPGKGGQTPLLTFIWKILVHGYLAWTVVAYVKILKLYGLKRGQGQTNSMPPNTNTPLEYDAGAPQPQGRE